VRAFTFVQLARAAGLDWLGELQDELELRFVIDSRVVSAGAIFAALAGERVDGHAFIEAAISKGATGLIVDEARVDHRAAEALAARGVVVLRAPDVLAALTRLASAYRDTWTCPVVGVTGSVGKTTTKDMIVRILSGSCVVAATYKNHNNQLGMPLSMLNAPEGARVAVFEIGISRPGDMDELVALLRPDMGVLVAVAAAHLEELGDLEGVAREKLGLLRALPAEGVAWYPTGVGVIERALGGIQAEKRGVGVVGEPAIWIAGFDADHVRFSVDGVPDDLVVGLPDMGAHVLFDAVLAVAVAIELGADPVEACRGVSGFEPGSQRAQWVKLGDVLLLDDSYNANEASTCAAIDMAAARARREGRRLVILAGEMLELGAAAPESHARVGRAAAASGADRVVFVGAQAAVMVEAARAAGAAPESITALDDSEAAAAWAVAQVQAHDLVLIKGSRGARMERARAALEGDR
jgi:UDP-N-acetylmuramoyl-tripeptide--D-alanyl-D-alanine ligase